MSGYLLLVDDEPALRRLGRLMLLDLGFQVVLAESGEQAVALFERDPSSFLGAVLDVSMPGMRGDEALVRLRAVSPDLPAVLVSGLEPDAVSRHVPHVFLPKPYCAEDLARALAQALGRLEPARYVDVRAALASWK